MTAATTLFNELVNEFSVELPFIKNLLRGGVELDDLQDVLDLRRDLDGSDDPLSARELVKAYRVAEGDIKLMAIAVSNLVSSGIAACRCESSSEILFGKPQISGVPWWCYPEDDDFKEIFNF